MFFTGSFDQTLAGWDTNTQQRVMRFEFPAKVYSISMAPHATSHNLIAVGTGDPQVKLCDPASGNVTHTLTGHREAVWWGLKCFARHVIRRTVNPRCLR